MDATQLRVMQQRQDEQQQLLEAIRQRQAQVQQQEQAQLSQDAPSPTAGTEKQLQQQLNMRGFDNIETLSGGEDKWQNWSWKIKTAVPGIHRELAEILDAAEADGARNLEEILKEDAFVFLACQQLGVADFFRLPLVSAETTELCVLC